MGRVRGSVANAAATDCLFNQGRAARRQPAGKPWDRRADAAPLASGGAKKERRSRIPRLFSMGTAESSAGLGGDVLFVQPRVVFIVRGGDAIPVLLTQPAAEVDQPAAGATEGALWPLLRPPLHQPLAYRATHLYHRKLTSWTWSFSPARWYFPSLWRPPLWRFRRFWRPRRSCRNSPPVSRLLPPTWRHSCTTRCGSRSGKIPNP